MALADISGAFDLHIHSAPCLFPRIGDDFDLARHAAEATLSGIVLKSHFECTVGRAALVGKIIPAVRVFGGLVLNGFAGGLNPLAVENALKMGARQIWFPTIDSWGHQKAYGHTGGFGYQESGRTVPQRGIRILSRGQLRKEVKIIVEMVRDSGAILGTGHLGREEIFPLTSFAKEVGFTRLLITHPFFRPPALTISDLLELSRQGAHLEFCGGELYPIPGGENIDTFRRAIAEVGARSIVLSSDAGQPRKSLPAEVLRIFAQCLMEKGVTQKELDVMLKENPRVLLGIQ
jgi:hypothetical protein